MPRARATTSAYVVSHAAPIAQNSSPSAVRPPNPLANCGSRLVKKTAIFGLPRLLSSPCR